MASERKRRSNGLRIRAMEERLKRMKDSKSMISDTLSGRTIPEAKHVTFEIDSDEDVIENIHNNNNRDIFGDNCTDSDTEMYRLPDKPQFEGKSGAELFKLQRQTRNDDRFLLDSRFADNEVSDVESEKKSDKFVEEKHKNLQILGDVLGKEIRTQRRPLIRDIIRFDPTLDSHKKYIIRKEDSEIQEAGSEHANKSSNFVLSEKIEIPTVTKETYYEYHNGSSIARLFENPQDNNANPEPGMFNFDIKEQEPVTSHPYRSELRQEESSLIGTEQHFRVESKDVDTESNKGMTDPPSDSVTHNLFFFHTNNSKLRNRIDDVKFCRQQDVETLTREWHDKAASLMRDCKRKHRDAVRWKRKSISIN